MIKLSDKIAYVQHDIDDSIRAGILKPSDLPRMHRGFGDTHSKRISTLVKGAVEYSTTLIERRKPDSLSRRSDALTVLRGFMFQNVYWPCL